MCTYTDAGTGTKCNVQHSDSLMRLGRDGICALHLSPDEKLPSGILKQEDSNNEFRRAIQDYIESSRRRKEVKFLGAIFPHSFDITDAFSRKLEFVGCRFLEGINLRDLRGPNLKISRSTITGPVQISSNGLYNEQLEISVTDTEFDGPFKGQFPSSKASFFFSKCRFKSTMSLKNDCADTVDFNDITFAKSPHLKLNVLGHSLKLTECAFPSGSKIEIIANNTKTPAIIEKVVFGTGSSVKLHLPNGSSIRGIDIQEHTTFEDCYFGKDADFSSNEGEALVVSQGSSFENCVFDSGTKFCGAQFLANTKFNQCSFSDSVTFEGCVFEQSYSMIECKFGNDISFRNAKFYDRCTFTNCKCGDNLSFNGTTFTSRESELSLCHFDFKNFSAGAHASFDGSNFNGYVNFSRSKNFEDAKGFETVSFRRSIFGGRVSFANQLFNNETDFRNCVFHVAPDFHGAELHSNIKFAGSQFLDVGNEDPDSAASAYRTLRIFMEQNRNKFYQARFFGLEQIAQRKSSEWSWLEKGFSVLYDRLAGYGTNIGGLFFGVLVCSLLPSALYAYIGKNPDFNWIEGATYNFQQVFQPFSVWSYKYASPFSDMSIWATKKGVLQFCGTLQSILVFAFLALFLLALRKRFKME